MRTAIITYRYTYDHKSTRDHKNTHMIIKEYIAAVIL